MARRKRILTSIIIGDFRSDFRSKFLIGADNLCIERFELVESSSSLWPNGKTFNLLREHEHEASTHRGEPSSSGPDGEPKIMIWFHNPCLPEQRLETFQSGNGYARSGIPGQIPSGNLIGSQDFCADEAEQETVRKLTN